MTKHAPRQSSGRSSSGDDDDGNGGGSQRGGRRGAKKSAQPAAPARMHTSREVYDRIKWDARFDAGEFVIGYADRARPEPVEIAFRDFVPDGDIPWHRIWYFRSRKGAVVWDRHTRLDAIFAPDAAAAAVAPNESRASDSAAATTPSARAPRAEQPRTPYRFDPAEGAWVPAPLRDEPAGTAADASARDDARGEPAVEFTVAVLNVLSDLHEGDLIDTAARVPAALEQLRACDADLIALVEVTPAFLAALCAAPWVREGYNLSDAPPDGASVAPMGQLVLSRAPFAWVTQADLTPHKRAISAGLAVGGHPLVVTAVHLPSDRGADANRARAKQLEQIAAHLAPGDDAVPWVVLGDFNLRDGDPSAAAAEQSLARRGLRDLWPALRPGEPGDTFDPARNALAGLLSRTGRAARFDRVYVRPGGPRAALRGVSVELFAQEPIAGHAAALPVSDHFGLRARLAIGAARAARPLEHAAPTYKSALVVAPPARACAAIQAIRKRHDRGYERWMPHVTLVYGFVDEAHFEEAARAVSLALEPLAPFEVTLARFDQFEHEGSSTVFLRPESTPSEALVALQGALAPLFPKCDEQSRKSAAGFTPHLTVARFPRAQAAEGARATAQWQRDWQPVRFTVDRVELISRRGEAPFASRATVMLGTGEVRWHDGDETHATATARPALATVLAGDPTPEQRQRDDDDDRAALERALATIAELAGASAEAPPDAGAEWTAVRPVGSYQLGLATGASDLDVVAFGRAPRAEFHARLLAVLASGGPRVRDARVVDAAVVPVVRCTVAGDAAASGGGVRVEVQYAQWPAALPAVAPEELDARDLDAFDPPSARAVAACRDAAAVLAAIDAAAGARERFATVARAVKRWSRARQVDANAFGYPGGFGWTVVAARACLRAPPAARGRGGGGDEHDVARVLEWLFADLAARDGQTAGPLAIAPEHAAGFARDAARDVMPVVTPAAPYRNVARNATRATREVVRREAARATELLRDARLGRARWDAWLAPVEPRRASPVRAQVELAGDPDGRGAGWVEGRALGLLLALERVAGAVRPYTRREAPRGADGGAWVWHVGLPRGVDDAAVRAAARELEAAYAAWAERPAASALRVRVLREQGE